MPYADPNKQRAYMRQKMRERRTQIAASKLDRVIPAGVESPVRPHEGKRSDSLRSESVYSVPATSTSPATRAEHAVIPPAVRPLVIPAHPSGRHRLLKQYSDLRAGGHDDSSAQAQLTQLRSQQQRQAQLDAHKREIAHLAPRFLGPARAYLSRGGAYREDQVPVVARQMAERTMLLKPPPLLKSPETLLLPSVAGGLVAVTTGFPKTDYRRIFPPPRHPGD